MTNIYICHFGLIVEDKGKVVDQTIFDDNPKEIADKLTKFNSGKSFKELDELKKKHPEAKTRTDSNFIKKNFRRLVEKYEIKNLNKLLIDINKEITKTKISSEQTRDKLIVHAISALNDLDKISNLMSERLREWFGLHYPEFEMKDHKKFAKMVEDNGKRENFPDFSSSVGIEFNEDDEKIIKKYADEVDDSFELKEKLEKYIEKLTSEEMPNIKALLGGLLSARLLEHAGSLEKLARMPSSKVQLIGAEKSMFRFLKAKRGGSKNAKPPRFGILCTHPDVINTKRELQGKIARLLSSKVSLAARMDFYSKEDKSKDLVKDYKEKLKKILGN